MADRITYVGLDVHKDTIVVAVAAGGLRSEVREYGRIANTPTALDRLLRKLGGDGIRLRFCYEAGPCGYGIQRRLSARGHECLVIAPSLIPKRAGDRVKTDRRDAASLAKLHRAGELTAVWVPDARHEAMRDLVRARLDAVHGLRRARQQLSGFLLRQGCHYRARDGEAWRALPEMAQPFWATVFTIQTTARIGVKAITGGPSSSMTCTARSAWAAPNLCSPRMARGHGRRLRIGNRCHDLPAEGGT
jgi:transposase